jgi:hypothetical protein
MNLMNNSNVIPLPGLRYAEMLQELKTNLWAEQFVKCLTYALQNNLGREPIARFIGANAAELVWFDREAEELVTEQLVTWIVDHCTSATQGATIQQYASL